MKLNIVTPLFRKQFLKKQLECIPKFPDINWILCKTKSWGNIPEEILAEKNINIIVSEVDCEDNLQNWVIKLSEGLKKTENGFFYILDDDNAIHPNLYKIYQKYKNDKYKMIIGDQILPDKNYYLKAHVPKYTKIDAGNVLCSTDLPSKTNYLYFINLKNYIIKNGLDWLFWIECQKNIKDDEMLVLKNTTIAYYNKLILENEQKYYNK